MTPRPVASSRPTDPPSSDRLARHDAQRLVADHHRVGVEHPAHHLRVGAGIGRGDVVLRADDRHDLAGVSAGEPLLLAHRELLRVADHAALGPAVGQIDQRVLPRLQHGQRHHLVHVDGGVVADAALERPAGVVVLGAVAGEDLDRPVVHLHRAGDRQHALGRGEHGPPERVEVHRLVDAVEIQMRVLPELGMLLVG